MPAAIAFPGMKPDHAGTFVAQNAFVLPNQCRSNASGSPSPSPSAASVQSEGSGSTPSTKPSPSESRSSGSDPRSNSRRFVEPSKSGSSSGRTNSQPVQSSRTMYRSHQSDIPSESQSYSGSNAKTCLRYFKATGAFDASGHDPSPGIAGTEWTWPSTYSSATRSTTGSMASKNSAAETTRSLSAPEKASTFDQTEVPAPPAAAAAASNSRAAHRTDHLSCPETRAASSAGAAFPRRNPLVECHQGASCGKTGVQMPSSHSFVTQEIPVVAVFV